MKKLLLSLLLYPFLICGIDYEPWYTPDIMVQPRIDVRYQTFSRVTTPHGGIFTNSRDWFLTPSVGLAAFGLSGDISTTIAKTRKQNFCVDEVVLSVRKLLMDDVVGDPFSLSIGITGIKAFKHSVHDLSSFHHGKIEGEMHVAVGKETLCGSVWQTHTWAMFGVGCADAGWVWLRGNLGWEKNWWDRHQAGVFVETLWGMGHKDLSPHKEFKGYGKIRHESVDLGMNYSYQFDFGGIISLAYSYRVFAHNFPSNASNIYLQFVYPMSVAEFPPTRWILQKIDVSSF